MQKIKKDLIDLFELEKLAPEKMLTIVEKLSRLVFQAVLVQVLPLLSDEDMAEYDRITESEESGEKLFLFLKEKVPNFEEIVQAEAENLHAELSEEFEKVGV